MTQILSKKLSGGSQERDSQVADLSFKNCSLGQKTGIFGLKKLWNKFKTAKRREPVVTFDAQLGFLVSTSSLRPSNSRICPGNGPKRPPEAPKCRQPQTKNRPYLWLHGSKCDSGCTYSVRNAPLFVVYIPQNCPNGRLDPNTKAYWVAATGKRKPKQVAAQMGQQGPAGAKR